MEDHWNQRFQECNHSTDLWDTDKPGFGMNGTYGDYLYAQRAVSVIEAHPASTPLFYYLAMQCAHDPMEVPDRFAARPASPRLLLISYQDCHMVS